MANWYWKYDDGIRRPHVVRVPFGVRPGGMYPAGNWARVTREEAFALPYPIIKARFIF